MTKKQVKSKRLIAAKNLKRRPNRPLCYTSNYIYN